MTPNGNGELDAVYDDALPGGHRPPPRKSSRRGIVIVGLAVLFVAVAIYSGIHSRIESEHALAKTTEISAVSPVNVVHPDVGAPNEELVLPGSTQAITDTPIYARTSGYLKRWTSDIGTHVKKGDLLAEIDTPEVDEQLRQMRADLDTAQATLRLAELTATRNEELLKTRSIATQERDNAAGALAVAKSNVASKQADVARLERMQSYEKVYAPFDGIITARNTDTGALINAGAGAAAFELFHLSAIDKIRVFVSIPEAYSRQVKIGDKAKVTLDEFPGEAFAGTLARSTNAIDPASRTLLVEVDVDNADGRLLPGAYAFVHLSLAKPIQSVTVPSNALIFRKDGIRVAVVRDGKAVMLPIVIGRDYGDKVEVVSGLAATDQVILDPSDSLVAGTAVQIAQPPAAPATTGAPK